MTTQSLVTKMIVQTFEEKVGKHQIRSKDGAKAIKFTFSLSLEYAKEEGYRHLDLVIYGPMNYVGVYTRERWTVVSVDDLEEGDDAGLKPGKDYTTGGSEWKQVAYHDSGWRTDGIDRVLREYAKRITGFSGPSFYEVIPVPAEIEGMS